MKIVHLLTFLGAALVLAGCGRPTPTGDTNAGAVSANDGRPSVAAFVSVNMGRVSQNDFVDSVSALYPHRCVVWLSNIKPGAAYQIAAELFDASGKSVLKKTAGIQADSPVWASVFDYQPPETLPKSGDWKWKVNVSGIGSAEKKFEMLEPSKSEQADLARHQKSREGVLFAFANTWVVSEDFGVPCYFTSLTSGRAGTDGKVETSGILEVAGLTCSFNHNQVSRADLFNGITYRGSAIFSFDVYRIWKEGVWSDWQDVERHSSAWGQALSELGTDLRRILPQGVPREAKNFLHALQLGGYNLMFDVMERDGHWYINSNNGAAWIDQRQTKMPDALRNAAPRYGFIEEQKKEADSPRRLILKETEDTLKKNKGGAPQDRPDILKTMKSVKETSL